MQQLVKHIARALAFGAAGTVLCLGGGGGGNSSGLLLDRLDKLGCLFHHFRKPATSTSAAASTTAAIGDSGGCWRRRHRGPVSFDGCGRLRPAKERRWEQATGKSWRFTQGGIVTQSGGFRSELTMPEFHRMRLPKCFDNGRLRREGGTKRIGRGKIRFGYSRIRSTHTFNIFSPLSSFHCRRSFKRRRGGATFPPSSDMYVHEKKSRLQGGISDSVSPFPSRISFL